MIFQQAPPLHLTYCLNIHPGESWDDVLSSITTYACRVRDNVANGQPFGLGLRVSAEAAKTLAHQETRDSFKALLAEHNLYVFTINGFPYGTFHGEPVKEQVYAPDWQTGERLTYTRMLAVALADLLPDGMSGSISTVPGSFRTWAQTPEAAGAIADQLASCVAHLASLYQLTGKEIHLGLEPEPACLLETTGDALTFFHDLVYTRSLQTLRQINRCSAAQAEQDLRRHLGVCVDTCHCALAFEDPAMVIQSLEKAGIRISKVQLSAALEIQGGPDSTGALTPFNEPVYLHQVRAQGPGSAFHAWDDLGEALPPLASFSNETTARIHFHVPLDWAGEEPLRSTRHTLGPLFWETLCSGPVEHAEIETYTFDVLPEALGNQGVTESIVREFKWVRAQQDMMQTP